MIEFLQEEWEICLALVLALKLQEIVKEESLLAQKLLEMRKEKLLDQMILEMMTGCLLA